MRTTLESQAIRRDVPAGTWPRPWAEGGRTDFENLVLLCRRHHRAVHEEDFRIERRPGGELRFLTPSGLPIPEAPPAPSFENGALEEMARELIEAGVDLEALAGIYPEWDGSRLDLAWAVETLRSAGRGVEAE